MPRRTRGGSHRSVQRCWTLALALALLVLLGESDPTPHYCGLPFDAPGTQAPAGAASGARHVPPNYTLPAAGLCRPGHVDRAILPDPHHFVLRPPGVDPPEASGESRLRGDRRAVTPPPLRC